MEKLVNEEDHPSWLTHGRTALVMKGPQQRSMPSNYGSITCLSTTWKLLSGILVVKIGVHISGYMHKAQKGIGGGSKVSRHSWILECLRLYKTDSRLVTFIRQ